MRSTIHCMLLAAALLCGSDAASAAGSPKTFASPDEAAKALVTAASAGDAKALIAILGPDAKALVQSGDAVADRQGRERFVRSYNEAHRIDLQGDAKAVLLVGKDEWPMPIPLVKAAGGWRFDARQGKEEILNRRIGHDELSTMQAVLAYVDAQREYYLRNPQGDKLLHYAQRFGSTPGKRDGLYYPTQPGESQSPLGQLYASAKAAGYTKSKDGQPSPYYGYHYRILTAQGSHAPGGSYSYLAQGRMIGGFALVAWPATYGITGVMTFIVNHEGVVYEKDLGPDTAEAVRKIKRFDPDKSWKRN
ncbi:MAG: DUF2950 domain-containing protein [Burkholderiales bacterium]